MWDNYQKKECAVCRVLAILVLGIEELDVDSAQC
jgi:hypothetical protein